MKVYVGRAEESEGYVAEALRLSRTIRFGHSGINTLASPIITSAGSSRRSTTMAFDRGDPPGKGIFHFYLASALALLGRASEAEAACATGCRLTPGFTVGKFRLGTMSDNPAFFAQRERVYEGLRKAGLGE